VIRKLLTGLIAAGAIAKAARSAGALTSGGSLAASGVGSLIFAGGGVAWSTLLLLFFCTSSLLSRLPSAGADRVTEKSGPRDAWQVGANGGVPCALAILTILRPSRVWCLPFAAALASAAADTWATEVGSRAGGTPRLVTTGKSVPPDTSGGVTWAGTGAAVLGASLLAASSTLMRSISPAEAGAAAVSGFLGCLCDTLLGATLQEQRRCPTCGGLTEQHVHRSCGTPTRHERGIGGLGNDAVNMLSCVAAACIAPAMHLLVRRVTRTP
jgi:uncharacterized protein (TIGR00297 family)